MTTSMLRALTLLVALGCQAPQQGGAPAAAGDSPRQAPPPTSDSPPPAPPAKDAPPPTLPTPAAQQPAGDLASARTAMMAAIGEARCTGTEQCRTIPAG
jgi:hypothetical protein